MKSAIFSPDWLASLSSQLASLVALIASLVALIASLAVLIASLSGQRSSLAGCLAQPVVSVGLPAPGNSKAPAVQILSSMKRYLISDWAMLIKALHLLS